MLSIATIVNVIMKRKNITKKEMLNKMNELDLGHGKPLNITHIDNLLSGSEKFGALWARRFEIVLDLEDGYLGNLVKGKGQTKRVKELNQKAEIQDSNRRNNKNTEN